MVGYSLGVWECSLHFFEAAYFDSFLQCKIFVALLYGSPPVWENEIHVCVHFFSSLFQNRVCLNVDGYNSTESIMLDQWLSLREGCLPHSGHLVTSRDISDCYECVTETAASIYGWRPAMPLNVWWHTGTPPRRVICSKMVTELEVEKCCLRFALKSIRSPLLSRSVKSPIA